jgi:ABC-type branched-subunit amino acid transport system ATPase component
MLEVRALDAFYGDSHILHGIDLQIPAGGRVAVLGRNGAGKSTLLKGLTNCGPTVKGDVRWNGQDLKGLASFERARLGIAFVPEDRRILANLSVLENLKMAWTGTPEARRTDTPEQVLGQFSILVPIKDRAGGVLSGGQQQLVAMARAAITNPKLLFLDEPTEGLAPLIVEELARDVARICQRNDCSLLLCEQSIWFARRCTDTVHLLDSGHLVFSGTWEEFDANDDVRMRHLAVA